MPISRQAKLILLFSGFVAFPAQSPAAEPSYPSLVLESTDERYAETVSVGGRTIVGIGVAKPYDAMYFSTWTPEAKMREFCLTITSQSGNYFAQANYKRAPSDSARGRHRLPYKPNKPEHLALLEKLGPQEIGLLIETSACDHVVAGPYLLGAWWSEVGNTPPEKISVMINSRSSDQVGVEIHADGATAPHYGVCKAVPAGRRQGFDRVCELTLHSASRQKIVVTTFGIGGDRNPPVEAEIIVPR